MVQVLGFVLLFGLVGCASSSQEVSSPNQVLEPVLAEEPNQIESPSSPLAEKLALKLKDLGYEGVGLEVETPEALETLLLVFSHPSASGRKIRQVYTGAANEYDSDPQSVTLSVASGSKSILLFLKKKIPLRKKP
jgi:hypothetical protein